MAEAIFGHTRLLRGMADAFSGQEKA